MAKQVEVHAYHGWGFNSNFWNSLKLLLPDNIIFKAADRGYFGDEYIPEYDYHSKLKVLFLHSFGLHWCAQEKIEEADIIIVFNSFDSFLPIENPARAKSKKVLDRMISQFKKEPQMVLTAFYENCYLNKLPDNSTHKLMNSSLLLSDLMALNKTQLKLSKNIKTNWLIIDSDKDSIVPGNRGQEIMSLIGADNYISINVGTHALPFANPVDSIKILSDAFPIFKSK